MTLPASFYALRQSYADTLAAITLLEPSLAPSREELPRESIAWDPNLVRLLALVPLSVGRWELLIADCWRRLDRAYMIDLVKRIADLKAEKFFAYHRNWYLQRLLELNEQQTNYERAIVKARLLWLDAKKESYT